MTEQPTLHIGDIPWFVANMEIKVKEECIIPNEKEISLTSHINHLLVLQRHAQMNDMNDGIMWT